MISDVKCCKFKLREPKCPTDPSVAHITWAFWLADSPEEAAKLHTHAHMYIKSTQKYRNKAEKCEIHTASGQQRRLRLSCLF